MMRIRQDPRYAFAVIFVYIEANLSWVTANDMARLCMQQRFYPTIVKSYDTTKAQRYGVWTGESEKEMYSNEMKRALGDGAIAYADDFISQDVNVKSEVRSQLEVYRRNVKFVEGSEKARVTYTGKSSGRRDDLAIVLQMLLYWSRYNRSSREYLQTAAENGWKF